MNSNDKKRQNKTFFWAVIVVLINLVQYFYHNSITIGVALIVTVYALYVITIKDKVEPNQTKNQNKK